MICAAVLALPLRAEIHGGFALMPETKLRISVVEWRSALGEYRDWTALSGEFRLAQDGSLSLPLIGELYAAGVTPPELAVLIANALQVQTGIVDRPVASVEITAYPPVFVTGEVDRPGAVEFSPGLTIGRLVALAGGQARLTEKQYRDTERDRLRVLGDLELFTLQRVQLLGRFARLTAEMDGAVRVAFPSDFTRPSGDLTSSAARRAIATAQRLEQALFAKRQQALARDLASLGDLETLLIREIEVLDEKIEVQKQQVRLSGEELARIRVLVERGTATMPRQTSLERIVADLESSLLDIVVASMRAKQKLNETRRAGFGLSSDRQTQVVQELRETENMLADVQAKHWTARQILVALQAVETSPDGQEEGLRPPLQFSVMRAGEARVVSEDFTVMPGDLVTVALGAPPPEPAVLSSRRTPAPRSE
ncbi:MAG: polysaccharide biosynthesis/export family protein [Sulfitobacter sp.]